MLVASTAIDDAATTNEDKDVTVNVVATDVDEPGLASLRESRPGTSTFVLDVRDLAAWERVLSEAEAQA